MGEFDSNITTSTVRVRVAPNLISADTLYYFFFTNPNILKQTTFMKWYLPSLVI